MGKNDSSYSSIILYQMDVVYVYLCFSAGTCFWEKGNIYIYKAADHKNV